MQNLFSFRLCNSFPLKINIQELYVFVTLGTKKLLENIKIFLLLSFLSSILKHQIVAIF